VADIRAVVEAVDRPLNVLAIPAAPPVAQLGELGVARISVGGAFAFAALGALAAAGREMLESGTFGYGPQLAAGRDIVAQAFPAA
jgi:2-methylisocitrate lyase-like PEP mutase family enzyme